MDIYNKKFITFDQLSIKFTLEKSGGLSMALKVAEDLYLSKIFGGSKKSKLYCFILVLQTLKCGKIYENRCCNRRAR